MPNKVTYNKTVSDSHVKAVLQRIADFFGKDVNVTSGDRDHVPKGGSKTSLHLEKRAADFHVAGHSDAKAFKLLKENTEKIFDVTEGYELIHHGVHTETQGEHLHIGHYKGKHKGYVQAKTEGLTAATKGKYSVEPLEIGKGNPVVASPEPTKPQPTKDPHPQDGEAHLSASVGEGGKNLYADVVLVQKLLNRAREGTYQGRSIGSLYARLAEDGDCRDKTKGAIRLFQKHVIGFQNPDAKVDPGGRTLRALSAWMQEEDKIPATKPVSSTTPKTNTYTGTLLQPSAEVEKAIRDAATKVGVDYGYMMAMAAQESSFNPTIKASTSSATGLYQFINQTWLGVVKKHGKEHGLAKEAEKIQYSSSKEKYEVSPFWAETEILDLRKNAKYSALMGAEFAKDNEQILVKKLKRSVSPTDLYMAHFLGPSNASKFLSARDAGKGGQSAAAMFPNAAKYNKSVFYKDGKARTLDQVYALMEKKIAPKAEAYSQQLAGTVAGKPTESTSTPPKTTVPPVTSPKDVVVAQDPSPQNTDEPSWLSIARGEMGQKEIAGAKHNKRIIEYHASTLLNASKDETPWCSSFVNWCMTQAGIKGTKSAAAASWTSWGTTSKARAGAVTVIYSASSANSSLSSSGNHVGFLVEETATHYKLLGGNQSDQVKESSFPKSKWKLKGYRWPSQQPSVG